MARLVFNELGLRIVGYGFQGLRFRISPSMRIRADDGLLVVGMFVGAEDE